MNVTVSKDMTEGEGLLNSESAPSGENVRRRSCRELESARFSSNEGRFQCADIDECVTMTHTCHQDATCANKDGSYDCNCLDGFTGEGRNADHGYTGYTDATDYGCVDNDECLTGTHFCVDNRKIFDNFSLRRLLKCCVGGVSGKSAVLLTRVCIENFRMFYKYLSYNS